MPRDPKSTGRRRDERVTLADIARVCGVSRVTVSKALRNDPKISEPTRRRVSETAEQLGYRPDPRLSELMTYLSDERRRSAGQIKETVAFVHTPPAGGVGMSHPDFFHAARNKLEPLGYRVEPFELSDRAYSSEALDRVLHARSIRAVIFAPLSISQPAPQLDWSRYAMVGFGQSWMNLRFPRFDWDYRRAVALAIGKLEAQGCQRVGVFTSLTLDSYLNHSIEAEATIHYRHQPRSRGVQPLVSNEVCTDENAHPCLTAWLKKHEPDGIVCSALNYQRMGRIGLIEPHIKYATWSRNPKVEPALSGPQPEIEVMAQQTSSLLLGMLQHGQYGMPKLRSMTFIEMAWQDAM